MHLEHLSLSIISREPTNFTAAEPALIDICACSEPMAIITIFSRISVPEMNSDHALIYGAYKVGNNNENPTEPEKVFYRRYNQINIKQLFNDFYAQNWNPIYETFDPDLQIQFFNLIIRWLLELHASLRKYVKRNKINL
jgi:hypothetical protein